MNISLDRILAVGCVRSFYLALGISLAIAFGQLSAGPAAAQINPEALLPPSRGDLPPSTMEDVPQRRYGQPAPGYRRSPYGRRGQHRGHRFIGRP